MDRKRLRTLHEIARHLSQSTGFGVVHLYNPNAVTQVHTDGTTHRENGQVERLNLTLLNALLTTTLEEDLWERELPNVQFAINNIPNRSTGKTSSQLLFGYGPERGADMALKDELLRESKHLKKKEAAQLGQKRDFDRKRKAPRTYRPGALVLIEKQKPATGASRKIAKPL
nr:unnamed protein product [Callosobruchus analis]